MHTSRTARFVYPFPKPEIRTMELIADPVLTPLPHAEHEALKESIRSPGP